jgi:hypothetical protein
MFLSLRALGFACLLATAGSAAAGPVLDASFDGDGMKQYAVLGNAVYGIASCPLDNGNLAVIGWHQQQAQWVVAHVKPDGQLDSTFSGDGIETESAPSALRHTATAMSCVGLGNGSRSDDAIVIAFVDPIIDPNRELLRTTHLNLDTGKFAAGFAGQSLTFDVSMQVSGTGVYLNLTPTALLRMASGEWLVVGGMHANGVNAPRRGFVLRLNAAMSQVTGAASPAAPGSTTEHIAVARVGGDGLIHVLGQGTAMFDPLFLAYLRLTPDTLQPDSGSTSSLPAGTRLHRGRNIGGGWMVAAATHPAAESGSVPELFVARDNVVRSLSLPMPQSLEGETATLDINTAALPTATGTIQGGVLFAASLRSDGGAVRGYYLARAVLDSNAASVVLDTEFGQGGAAQFRLRGPGGCTFPQPFGNISSWGNATALVGTAPPGCDVGQHGLLAARIVSEPWLLRDSFE